MSDTHGLIDPALPQLFAGCEAIVHGGDIVGVHVIEALQALAPVQAIVGNCDGPPLTRALPEWRMIQVHGERILVLHDLGTPERIRPPAARLIAQQAPTIVISGHSHKGALAVRDGVLFVNPGSAGKKRFSLPRTAAVLIFGARHVEARLLSLEAGPGDILQAAKKPRAQLV